MVHLLHCNECLYKTIKSVNFRAEAIFEGFDVKDKVLGSTPVRAKGFTKAVILFAKVNPEFCEQLVQWFL